MTLLTNREEVTLAAVDASGLNSSTTLDASNWTVLSVQVVHASHDDTSTWELQATFDGTNWDTISGTSTTTSGASGSASIQISTANFTDVRLTVTEVDANASATLTPTFILKRI